MAIKHVTPHPILAAWRTILPDVMAIAGIDLLTGVDKEHLKEAEERLNQAVVLGEELVTSYPAVPQYKVSLASSMRKLGRVMQDLGRAKEAVDSFREAYKIESSLEKRFPQVPGYVLNLAEAQHSLGDNLRIQGRFQDARHFLERAIALQEKFLENVPDTRGSLNQMATL